MSSQALTEQRPIRFTVAAPEEQSGHLQNVLALSPDGGTLVYESSRGGLRRRRLGQLEAEVIEGAGGSFQFFSPDGASIGFFTEGALRKLNVDDGVAATVVGLPPGAGPTGASWGSDDSIVFALARSGLQRVLAVGSNAETITTVDAEGGEADHRHPSFLPGGRAVLYTVTRSEGESQVAVHSFETGQSTILVTGTYPLYVETGHLLFVRPRPDIERGALWAAPFDADRLEMTGEARPVIDNVHLHTSGAAQVAVSGDGTLAYVHGDVFLQTGVTPVWVDRAGVVTPLAGLAPGRYEGPQMSPDGRSVAFMLDGDIWTYDVARQAGTRLTRDVGLNMGPRWTPDGSRIVFGSSGTPGALHWQAADGSGGGGRIEVGLEGEQVAPTDVTPDGSILFRAGGRVGLLNSVAKGEPATFFDDLASAAVSPNGRWLAYASGRSGQSEIYVERFPTRGDLRTISTEGGANPVWSPEGDELFYLDLEGTQIMSVSVGAQADFVAGEPEPVVTGQYERPNPFISLFDISPRDGRFIVVPRPTAYDAGVPITIVTNWFQELTERVPTN